MIFQTKTKKKFEKIINKKFFKAHRGFLGRRKIGKKVFFGCVLFEKNMKNAILKNFLVFSFYYVRVRVRVSERLLVLGLGLGLG